MQHKGNDSENREDELKEILKSFGEVDDITPGSQVVQQEIEELKAALSLKDTEIKNLKEQVDHLKHQNNLQEQKIRKKSAASQVKTGIYTERVQWNVERHELQSKKEALEKKNELLRAELEQMRLLNDMTKRASEVYITEKSDYKTLCDKAKEGLHWAKSNATQIQQFLCPNPSIRRPLIRSKKVKLQNSLSDQIESLELEEMRRIMTANADDISDIIEFVQKMEKQNKLASPVEKKERESSEKNINSSLESNISPGTQKKRKKNQIFPSSAESSDTTSSEEETVKKPGPKNVRPTYRANSRRSIRFKRLSQTDLSLLERIKVICSGAQMKNGQVKNGKVNSQEPKLNDSVSHAMMSVVITPTPQMSVVTSERGNSILSTPDSFTGSSSAGEIGKKQVLCTPVSLSLKKRNITFPQSNCSKRRIAFVPATEVTNEKVNNSLDQNKAYQFGGRMNGFFESEMNSANERIDGLSPIKRSKSSYHTEDTVKKEVFQSVALPTKTIAVKDAAVQTDCLGTNGESIVSKNTPFDISSSAPESQSSNYIKDLFEKVPSVRITNEFNKRRYSSYQADCQEKEKDVTCSGNSVLKEYGGFHPNFFAIRPLLSPIPPSPPESCREIDDCVMHEESSSNFVAREQNHVIHSSISTDIRDHRTVLGDSSSTKTVLPCATEDHLPLEIETLSPCADYVSNQNSIPCNTVSRKANANFQENNHSPSAVLNNVSDVNKTDLILVRQQKNDEQTVENVIASESDTEAVRNSMRLESSASLKKSPDFRRGSSGLYVSPPLRSVSPNISSVCELQPKYFHDTLPGEEQTLKANVKDLPSNKKCTKHKIASVWNEILTEEKNAQLTVMNNITETQKQLPSTNSTCHRTAKRFATLSPKPLKRVRKNKKKGNTNPETACKANIDSVVPKPKAENNSQKALTNGANISTIASADSSSHSVLPVVKIQCEEPLHNGINPPTDTSTGLSHPTNTVPGMLYQLSRNLRTVTVKKTEPCNDAIFSVSSLANATRPLVPNVKPNENGQANGVTPGLPLSSFEVSNSANLEDDTSSTFSLNNSKRPCSKVTASTAIKNGDTSKTTKNKKKTTAKKQKEVSECPFRMALKDLEQVKYNEGEFPRFKRNLINALQNPIYVKSVDEAVEMTTNYLKTSNRNPLKLIHKNTDKVLPSIENCIVQTFYDVEKKSKSHLYGLMEKFMVALRFRALTDNSLTLCAITAFCRVYTAACKENRESKKYLQLARDFYFDFHSSQFRRAILPICAASIVSVWPDVYHMEVKPEVNFLEDVDKMVENPIFKTKYKVAKNEMKVYALGVKHVFSDMCKNDT